MRFETDPLDPFSLMKARVHEAEGLGRYGFAVFQAARSVGAVIWVIPNHAPHLPMLRGLPVKLAERLYILRPKSEQDLLWSVEEALRTKGLGLVIAEPEKPLSLLAGRRLQLAAETGRTTGLMLIRQDQGSNAAQTRWYCMPVAAQQRDLTLHQWILKKNKKGTFGNWTVDWNGKTGSLHLVSAAGQRYGPAETP
jgi:protein ImuA